MLKNVVHRIGSGLKALLRNDATTTIMLRIRVRITQKRFEAAR